MKHWFCFSAAVAVLCLFLSLPASAQAQDGAKSSSGLSQEQEAVRPISETTKKCKVYQGLFTFYQDTVSGAVYMLIRPDQFGKEYIYFDHVVDGVLDAGFFRGAYGGSRIFRMEKYFDRVEFIEENTRYYFDTANALSKASGANINKPILASQKIMGMNADKKECLVRADDLFLNETFRQVKSGVSDGKPGAFSMGNLSKEKSKFLRIKNYPMNTDVIVEYVFDNPYPTNSGNEAVTDSRYISVTIQHSLIEVPKNNFVPRADDPRIGYFTQRVNDMTSTSATPYRDIINRWHLEKKDKNAALSEPVEPIVWWIENTTPRELRPAIRSGVLAWNIAFEKAGFKNAIVVKEQPDDADWDAGDIRYNVLRWTSSPAPPFGGYGPSFVNPRTGQILGADIMLEFIYVTKRLQFEKLFSTAGLEYLQEPQGHDPYRCDFGTFMQHSMLFGLNVLNADGLTKTEEDEFMKQSLYRLVLHEVGHTFGLNHNFKASQLHDLNEIYNKQLTENTGLTGSVMEYPAINIAPDKDRRGHYYDYKPGPYDMWAIEYGYSVSLDDPAAEHTRLQTILSRSTEPALAFCNDADNMGSPGKGIDPRCMTFDLSGDAIGYSIDRIKIVNQTMPKIKEKYSTPGQSYHELRNAYLILTGEYATALRTISRYIGGVYVDRAFTGQAHATKPFVPVSYQDQKRAMTALNEYAFGSNAFQEPDDLYNYLQMQRRGFDNFGTNEDPKIHERILNVQEEVLDQLLHPDVLKRITDSELYGNEYKLAEFMDDLTDAIFGGETAGKTASMRRNIQAEYVDRLVAVLDKQSKYDHLSQSMALYELTRIKGMLGKGKASDTAAKAHRQLVLFKIDKAMEKDKG